MGTRFKASETLLGIETLIFNLIMLACFWFKASETLLGIETDRVTMTRHQRDIGFKASETLLGIETTILRSRVAQAIFASWFKASETLLGIETVGFGQ